MCISRRILLSVSLLLVGVALFSATHVQAQQLASARITEAQVTTMDGKAVRDAPLMAGATYKVSFVIEAAAGLKEQAVLKTNLVRAPGSDRFWTLKGTYPGIDATSWQPGQSVLLFDAIAGKAELELQGSVPEDYVAESLSTGQSLHVAKPLAILELALASGTVVSDLKIEVIDASIEEFRSVLNAKQSLLAGMDADPTYVNLVRAMVTTAEAQATAGYVDLALETLKAVPDSGWIEPRASTSYQWIIIGVLAIIVGVFGFLLVRARSETGFIKRQTDSQAKRLQVLALKAKRIGDSALTEGIEQVSKELQQSAGGS
jgi:hypothetical protein